MLNSRRVAQDPELGCVESLITMNVTRFQSGKGWGAVGREGWHVRMWSGAYENFLFTVVVNLNLPSKKKIYIYI